MSKIQEKLSFEVVKELNQMVCAEPKDGKSCIERVRPWQEMCLVCKAHTIMEMPMVDGVFQDE